MKIQVMSDLHYEFLRGWDAERKAGLIPKDTDADVLVLAGDIDHSTRAMDMVKNWPIPVVIVPGNHEHYGTSLGAVRQSAKEKMSDKQYAGIHWLDNSEVVINGVRFLGCTMWTDCRLYGHDSESGSEWIESSTKDLAHIENFSTQEWLAENQKSVDWLKAKLSGEFDGKTVVVTHYGVHEKSLPERFRFTPSNVAFLNHYPWITDSADLVIHGHLHNSSHYGAGMCQVAVNPQGYIRAAYLEQELWQFENEKFDPKFVIEV